MKLSWVTVLKSKKTEKFNSNYSIIIKYFKLFLNRSLHFPVSPPVIDGPTTTTTTITQSPSTTTYVSYH